MKAETNKENIIKVIRDFDFDSEEEMTEEEFRKEMKKLGYNDEIIDDDIKAYWESVERGIPWPCNIFEPFKEGIDFTRLPSNRYYKKNKENLKI